MRDMANQPQTASRPRRRARASRIRPWVQTAFLALWLAPISKLHFFPGCAFHCYACPLWSFACPVGVAATFAALHVVPLLAIGLVVLIGALVGSFVCGWACPFGLIQDLLAKVPVPKLRLPAWAGWGRYLVLAGAVVAVPMIWGMDHPLSVCRICPAGAIEGGVVRTVMGLFPGQPAVAMSAVKWIIVGVFVAVAISINRPWCRVLCPLGGVLSLFNRFSLFHLSFARSKCTQCNVCRSRCPAEVALQIPVDNSRCVRCLECKTCGAIEATFKAKV